MRAKSPPTCRTKNSLNGDGEFDSIHPSMTRIARGSTATLGSTRWASAKGDNGETWLWSRGASSLPRSAHECRQTFEFYSISPSATGVEVFGLALLKSILFQRLEINSPNARSHEVQRISALRDRIWELLAPEPVLCPSHIALKNNGLPPITVPVFKLEPGRPWPASGLAGA